MTHSPSAVEPLAYLSTLEQFGIKLGLDNIRTILGALDDPQRAFRAAHIAGTNGKGSVTALIDAALRAAGHRTGRYTSPHLVRLAERFAIDGKPASDADLSDAVSRLRSAVEPLVERGVLETAPTFFEATTAIAFDLFRNAGVQVAVIEVGLGGRLDATNVLEPEVTAITTIGLDHQRHLGSTIRDIAREKGGIIKPGIPVIVGNVPPDALDEIQRIAGVRGAPMIRAFEGVRVSSAADVTGPQRLRLRTPAADYGEIPLALAGEHQIHNAVVAVRLLETLADRGVHMPREAIEAGLARVRWPGRIDRRILGGGREVLLDAAHNPDGASALAAFLRQNPPKQPIVFGVSRDKDSAGMLEVLAPVAGAFVLTRASSVRGTDPEELAARLSAIAPELPQQIAATPHEALALAWAISPRIVVAGSIFLIGDVLSDIGAPW